LRITPDRTRPDEAAAFDRQPDALRDLDDRLHVADNGPRGAVRLDLELRLDNLARQALDVAHHVRTRARQADVGGVDADFVEQPQDAELLFDRRRAHGWRLHRRVAVPVVDERLVHGLWRLATTPATLAPATRTAPPHMSPCWTDRSTAGRMISSMVTARR